MSMASSKAVAGESIASRGESYGIKSVQIDGNDVEKVFKTVKNFKNEILETKSPRFIEAVTYRYRGHSKSDRNLYRTSDEINYWKEEKDPIKRFIGKLQEEGVSEEQLKELDGEVVNLIRTSVKKALDSPLSPETNLEEDSYA